MANDSVAAFQVLACHREVYPALKGCCGHVVYGPSLALPKVSSKSGGGGGRSKSSIPTLIFYQIIISSGKETMSAFLESILHEIKSRFKNPLVQHYAGFVIVLT